MARRTKKVLTYIKIGKGPFGWCRWFIADDHNVYYQGKNTKAKQISIKGDVLIAYKRWQKYNRNGAMYCKQCTYVKCHCDEHKKDFEDQCKTVLEDLKLGVPYG